MRKFDNCLKASDVTVWLKLQQQDIKPQYYAFRWLTLLLSQEFELPGVTVRWSDEPPLKDRQNCAVYIICVFPVLVSKCLVYVRTATKFCHFSGRFSLIFLPPLFPEENVWGSVAQFFYPTIR